MTIPDFLEDGVLPEGVIDANLEDIETKLSFTDRRTALVSQLKDFIRLIPSFEGIEYILVDGSFVEDKAEPRDIDMVLVVHDLAREASLVGWVNNSHKTFKAIYRCDVYVADEVWVNEYWLKQFGTTREKKPKGMIRLHVGAKIQ